MGPLVRAGWVRSVPGPTGGYERQRDLDSLTVLEGMTTVDASRVQGDLLGHTLFGSSALLSDLFAVLTEGRAPADRRLLQVRRPDGSVSP